MFIVLYMMKYASQGIHLSIGNLLCYFFELYYQPIFYFGNRNQPLFFYLRPRTNLSKLYWRIFKLSLLSCWHLGYHLEYELNYKLLSFGSILNLFKFSLIFFTLMPIFVSPSELHFSLFQPHESQIISLASLSLALLAKAIC
jgi:hypothetical protein